MVKHTKTIRRQYPTNCLSVFDHFVELTLNESEFIELQMKVRIELAANIYFENKNSLFKYIAFYLSDLPHLWLSDFLNIFHNSGEVYTL